MDIAGVLVPLANVPERKPAPGGEEGIFAAVFGIALNEPRVAAADNVEPMTLPEGAVGCRSPGAVSEPLSPVLGSATRPPPGAEPQARYLLQMGLTDGLTIIPDGVLSGVVRDEAEKAQVGTAEAGEATPQLVQESGRVGSFSGEAAAPVQSAGLAAPEPVGSFGPSSGLGKGDRSAAAARTATPEQLPRTPGSAAMPGWTDLSGHPLPQEPDSVPGWGSAPRRGDLPPEQTRAGEGSAAVSFVRRGMSAAPTREEDTRPSVILPDSSVPGEQDRTEVSGCRWFAMRWGPLGDTAADVSKRPAAEGTDAAGAEEALSQVAVAGNELSVEFQDPDEEGAAVRRTPGGFRTKAAAERLWGFWLRRGGVGELKCASAEVAAKGSLTAEKPVAFAREFTPELHEDVVPEVNPPDPPAPAPRGLAEGEASSPQQPGGSDGVPVGDRGIPVVSRPLQTPRIPEHFSAPAAQVAHAVRVCVARGGDRVTVHLEPESLGKIHIVLSRENGGLAAHFRVENPEILQAFDAQLPVLRHALESRGVSLTQVFVELAHRDGRGEDLWEKRSTRRGRRSPGEELEPEGVDGLGNRPAPWRSWGFDTRI